MGAQENYHYHAGYHHSGGGAGVQLRLFPAGDHPGNDSFTAAGVDFIAALGVVT